MKKLLIVSYYWPPSGGPGVQRAVKFVKYLPVHGIEPVVLSVLPEYASYPFLDHSLEKEVAANIRVLRTQSLEPLQWYRMFSTEKDIPKPGFANEGQAGISKKIMRFLRGNFMIPDARKGWNRYAIKTCRELLQKENFSAIFTTSPPHSTQLIGLKLQNEFKLPWIADMRDPWTDIYYNHRLYRSRPAKNEDARLERQVLEQAGSIITVSETLKKLLASKSQSIKADKIHVIPNGYDPEDFKNDVPSNKEVFTITYTGTISNDYPVYGFIQALQSFMKTQPGSRLAVRFIGQISETVCRQLEASGIMPLVQVEAYMEHADAIKAMMTASLLLLIIPDTPHNEAIMTGKLFEYMASRRPIIAFGPARGEVANVLHSCESGKIFHYGDAADAAHWISELYSQFANGISLPAGNQYIEKYSRYEQAGQLVRIINNIA